MTDVPMRIPLHDYQIYAKNFLLQHPYCGLFLQMGLGKTGIVLEALWELNPNQHVLVIAPKTIARCTWVNEIEKWGMNFRTQSLLVNERGKQLTKKKREEIYDTIRDAQPTVYFINREMLPNLVSYFMYDPKRAKNKTKPQKHAAPPKHGQSPWPFGIVVIDESQSFKSYTAERFKAMKIARDFTSRVILLTGSPAPKSLEDLWPQIYLLDKGARLGTTITSYRNQYFNPGLIVNNYPVQWIPKPGAEEQIYQLISDLVISMKNKYITLPPLTFNPISVEMDEDERKLYKEFMKTSVLDLGDGQEIEAVNAAVLSAKLSQMASGAIYTNAKAHEYHLIHKHKLEVCEYIINNTQGNVLIAYHFQSDKQMLLEYFKEVDIPAQVFDGSPEMERAWNKKQIRVLLLQPASCGFGLNLQEGGCTLIWYTLPWSLEEYEQTNARIYRQGQTEPVVIHQLMTRGTIDTKILKALEQKDLSQQRLLDAVEATLKDKTEDSP